MATLGAPWQGEAPSLTPLSLVENLTDGDIIAMLAAAVVLVAAIIILAVRFKGKDK